MIQLFSWPRVLVAAVCLMAQPAMANPQLAYIEGARVNMEAQAPFIQRGKGLPHDHEITVYLPAGYASEPARTYPVLWVPDAPMMLRTVVGIQDTLVIGNMAPEMIIIGVGSRSEDGLEGLGRRVIDFSPPGADYFPRGLRGEAWEELAPLPEFPHLADAFLGFLVDELRPELAARYRFSGDHALFGHSAGGMFAAHSLFARPGAFDKMIIGSPYLEGVRGAAFKAEEAYARHNKDLDTDLFIGVGANETDEYFLAASGIVSGAAAFSETLRLRRYPSMALSTRIYSDEDHYTVVPRVISDGIRTLWADDIKDMPSSWPQAPE